LYFFKIESLGKRILKRFKISELDERTVFFPGDDENAQPFDSSEAIISFN